MPDKVLIYSRFPKSAMARIAQRFDLIDAGGKPPAEVVAQGERQGLRALITAGGQPLGVDIMDSLPALGAIVCYGTGYDGVDLEAARARSIQLANSPGANAAAVADLAMTLMLAVTRRLIVADNYLRSGGWANAQPSPMMKAPMGLRGRRVGLYGIGEIGRKIAARAAAFETDIGYHSRSRHDLPYQYFDSLPELAQWCDVLVIAVRAGPQNRHAINADILRRLGPDGIVVNIARGSMIDEAALLTALREGTIAGAGLDVFETEPHPPGSLSELPNVVLTPHIGGHTTDAHVAMQDCVIANLQAFFAGEPLPYAVPV
jgi:lactate dehydrogenase-like 2-hydroxyacid dehydrogenase